MLDTEVLLNVLLTVFLLPPRTGVGLLRPEERRRLCGGVPVWVDGLGILSTQFGNVGGGSRRGQVDVMAWFAVDKTPLRAQYSAYRARARMEAGAGGLYSRILRPLVSVTGSAGHVLGKPLGRGTGTGTGRGALKGEPSTT